MPTETPSYLRLHRPSAARSESSPPAQSGRDAGEEFWSVFSSATGWRIDSHAARREQTVNLIPAVEVPSMLEADFDNETFPPNHSTVLDRDLATRMAIAATRVIGQWNAAEQALSRSGVATAADAWSVAELETFEDAGQRIQRHLADGVAATGTTVAVLSMLDDDTETLSIASTFGLPSSAMTAAPRNLRGSRGDLEAMVNQVVMADEFRGGGIDSWNAPLSADGDYQSGICVSIRSGDLPIGTLWLLSHESISYQPGHAASARLVAAAIENDLATLAASGRRSDLAVEESVSEGPVESVPEAAPTAESDPQRAPQPATPRSSSLAELEIGQWQYGMLPHASRLAENWFADGMIESPSDYATGFHVWDVLPDGTLMLAIAQAEHGSLDGAMVATITRGAIASHGCYRHGVTDMVRRVSDTLWQAGTIESPISLLYGHVDPDDGTGEIALAGNLRALIANRYGYRPLASEGGSPIGIHVECPVKTFDFQMQAGETMVGYGPGWTTDGITQQAIGAALHDAAMAGSQHPLAALRRRVAGNALGGERGAIALTRWTRNGS